jgi:ABC-type multidrug transport system fused ATPase/permease subunit
VCLAALAAVYAVEPLFAGVVITAWSKLRHGDIQRLLCAANAAALARWNTRSGVLSPKEMTDKHVEKLEECSANNITTADSGPRAVFKFLGAMALLSATSPRLAPVVIAIFVGAIASISRRVPGFAVLQQRSKEAREALGVHRHGWLQASTNARSYDMRSTVDKTTERLSSRVRRVALPNACCCLQPALTHVYRPPQVKDAQLAEQEHKLTTSQHASYIITLAWCAIQACATWLRDVGAPLSVFELQAALGFTLMLTMSTTGVLTFIRDYSIATRTKKELEDDAAPPDEATASETASALQAALAAAEEQGMGAELAMPGTLPSTLQAGRVYTLMGPSGSGKSKCIDQLAGQPSGADGAGTRVLLCGKPLGAAELASDEWRRKVAYMPQTATTELPPLTVWKLLRAGCPKARLPLVRQVCHAFGLHKMNLKAAADGNASWEHALKKTQATNLSAGQKQRVALAAFFIRGAFLRVTTCKSVR